MNTRGRGKIKTPISYYGGKQQLSGKIVKILEQSPVQKLYCEPFSEEGLYFLPKNRRKLKL